VFAGPIASYFKWKLMHLNKTALPEPSFAQLVGFGTGNGTAGTVEFGMSGFPSIFRVPKPLKMALTQ
jgi:hypothetical protein